MTLIKLEMLKYTCKLRYKTERYKEKGCPNGLQEQLIYTRKWVGRKCTSCAPSSGIRATK